jgi:hypothetical protein
LADNFPNESAAIGLAPAFEIYFALAPTYVRKTLYIFTFGRLVKSGPKLLQILSRSGELALGPHNPIKK